MDFGIKSIDHAFAAVLQDTYKAARAVSDFEQKKIQPDAAGIEAVSSLIPVYGAEITLIEKLAFASLGVIAALLHKYGTPEKAAASAPGLSLDVLTGVAAFLQLNPSLVTKADSLVKTI
jgi:hypothetical protein